MKARLEKPVTCPNCFGTSLREVLTTATSRNIVHDNTAPPLAGAPAAALVSRDKVVKLLCNHCGHELSRQGGRA